MLRGGNAKRRYKNTTLTTTQRPPKTLHQTNPQQHEQFGEGQAPDVWFDAVAVWEVKAADLSISPVHQAAKGVVEAGKGISIR